MSDYCGACFDSCKVDKNAFALRVHAFLYTKLDEITEIPLGEPSTTYISIGADVPNYQSAFWGCLHFALLFLFLFFFRAELHPSYTSASNTLLLNEFQWMGTKLSLGSALVKLSHWPLNQHACSLMQAPLLSSCLLFSLFSIPLTSSSPLTTQLGAADQNKLYIYIYKY